LQVVAEAAVTEVKAEKKGRGAKKAPKVEVGSFEDRIIYGIT
jgi:hypothetical protein